MEYDRLEFRAIGFHSLENRTINFDSASHADGSCPHYIFVSRNIMCSNKCVAYKTIRRLSQPRKDNGYVVYIPETDKFIFYIPCAYSSSVSGS